MTSSIRVLVCDDHTLLRSGLRLLLDAEPDIAVVGEASNADEAIASARALEPDVVLLDIVMPGRNGVDAIPDLVAAAPVTRVLVLSMQADLAYVRRAFAFGATGYLVKEAADTELVEAVREVAAGRSFVHPALGGRLTAVNGLQSSGTEALPEREREVLRLLALGHTNQEIAKLLSVSVRTVETHRAHLARTLGLKTRAEIVGYAFATGQLEAPRSAQAT